VILSHFVQLLQDFTLTHGLDDAEKRNMLAYMSLVNTVLGNAEVSYRSHDFFVLWGWWRVILVWNICVFVWPQSYFVWIDENTRPITRQRYGSVYPFPLNYWVTYLKMKSVNSRLKAVGWLNMKLDQVYQEVDKCCEALSKRLGNSQYFFGGCVLILHRFICDGLYVSLVL